MASGAARVAVVGLYLDPRRRHPRELLQAWREFGTVPAAAARQGAAVTMVQAAWQDYDCDVDGVPCHFVRERLPLVPVPGRRGLRRRPRRLFERVAALSPDLVHLEGLILPHLVPALASAVPGIPILAQDHGAKPPPGWRRRLWRWGFDALAGVTFTARDQAEPFVAAGILRPDLPVFEVVEGSTAFRPGDVAAARSVTGLDGDPCLLWVGNLDPNKDPLTILDAIERATTIPDARLHMCFRAAPLLDEVRRRVESPGLAGRVVLHGEVRYPDIEMYFRAADCLVQGSHVEGSGYGLLEALACGVTPLVTDIPSFRRMTADAAVGALVPTGDAEAFARALDDWSQRDRAEMRRLAREHFDRHLSFDAIGRQLVSAYEAVRRSA